MYIVVAFSAMQYYTVLYTGVSARMLIKCSALIIIFFREGFYFTFILGY